MLEGDRSNLRSKRNKEPEGSEESKPKTGERNYLNRSGILGLIFSITNTLWLYLLQISNTELQSLFESLQHFYYKNQRGQALVGISSLKEIFKGKKQKKKEFRLLNLQFIQNNSIGWSVSYIS